MTVQLTNLLDYDLDGIRTGTNTGKLVHKRGFDPAARFQMIGTGMRKQLSTTVGKTTGMSVVVKPVMFVGSWALRIFRSIS